VTDALTAPEEDQDDSKKPTTELDNEQLFIRFKKWWGEDKDHCEKWHAGARDDYDFAALDQWTEEERATMREQMRVPLTFDRTGVIIDSVTGAEVANRQEVRYVPRSVGDAAKNEALTEGARWFRDQCNADHEESHAFRDTVICGMGWTETRLDYEENPDGDPRIDRTDPLCMYWDHAARKPNLSDARRVWRVYRDMPIDEARSKFQVDEDEDLNAAWAKAGDDGDDPYNASRPRYRMHRPPGDDSDTGPDTVTIVEIQWIEREVYYRGTVQQPPPPVDPMAVDPMSGMPLPPAPPPPPEPVEHTEEQHITMLERAPQMGWQYRAVRQVRKVHYRAFVGGKVLESGKLFEPPGGAGYAPKGHCRRFGYQCITGKLDRNEGTFYGLMRVMKDPQKMVNKWLSQILHIMNTTAKGGTLAERGSFDDDIQAEETWARPDAITWMKSGSLSNPNGARIQPKPVSGFPPQLMQLTELGMSSIRDATGVNAEMLGLRSADQAASLESQRTQAATTILAPLFDSLKLYRRMQGEVLLYLIVNYLADGRLIRIVDDSGAGYQPFQMPDDMVTFDVIVDDAPNSPNQKQQTWQIMQTLLPAIGKMIPPKVWPVILEFSPLPSSGVAKIKEAMEPPKGPDGQPMPPEDEPEVKAAKAKLEIEKAAGEQKMQLETAKAQTDAQLKKQEMEANLMLEMQKLEAELKMANQKMMFEAQMKQQQLELDEDHQNRKWRFEANMKRRQMGEMPDDEGQQQIEGPMAKVLEQIAAMAAETYKVASAPRRSTLHRGADGKPSHSISTIEN